MLRIVLPVTVAVGRPIRNVLSVGVVHKGVIVIDGHVIVTAPATVVAPAATPGRSHCDPDAKRNRHTRSVIPRWRRWRINDRRIRIHRRAVHHRRVVARNVNYLWTGLLNHDDLLALHNLGFHFLLLTCFQVSRILGLLAHPLYCIHHIALLSQKSVAQVRRPLDVFGHLFDNIRKGCHGLDAWIPILFLHGVR
jgi:hypothetical protein